jgi:thiol:disulfide interchange protein DsbD
MRLIRLLAILVMSPLPHAVAEDNPLDIRLISEVRSIRAGGTFQLGLHLRHPAGFHTYWKHPGIVGLATQLEWELPEGFTAGPIEWPAPESVRMAIYHAQGYHGETLLMIPIKAPANLTEKSVTLAARASWMCCAKTCHPAAKVPLAVTLPVAASAEPDPTTRLLFEKFRALVPKPDPAWRTTVARANRQVMLTLHPPGGSPAAADTAGIRFFTADGQIDSNQAQPVEILANGGIRLRLALSENVPPSPAKLPGVVVFPNGWPPGGPPLRMEIDPIYENPPTPGPQDTDKDPQRLPPGR